jgi:hypothetical protein
MSIVFAARAALLAKVHSSGHCYGWIEDRSSISAEGSRSEPRITQLDSATRKMEEGIELSLQPFQTATEQLPVSAYLEESLTDLFLTANEGLFEEDQVRKFSEKLTLLLYTYGDATIECLAPYIIGERANAETASATLRCLSHIDSRVSYNYRIWIMERALQSTSSWIRDAAGLALESMDDPSAVPFLQEAFKKESNHELHQFLQSVLEYLQRKR